MRLNRRTLLASAAAAPLAATFMGDPLTACAAEPAADWRRFEVTTRVTMRNSTGPAQLFLPVGQTAGGYQTSLDLRCSGTGRAALVHDARYGAGLIRVEWDGGDAPQQAVIVQTIATRDRGAVSMLPLTAAERAFWTAATPSAPTDGIVHDTAVQITAGKTTPKDSLRAIYDWIVDTTWRNPETPGCGTGDYGEMLRTGNFGGKCADINGLAVGLARAAGFPARDVYGIRVADSKLFPSIGKSGDISKAQHCRAEVFLDDEGWFPIDPADVRKVVLEGKLPIEHPAVRVLRDRLFGTWEMNWIGYNSANDIELPGAGGRAANFSFLMYPCGFTASGQPDCLDPARFSYEIRSEESAA